MNTIVDCTEHIGETCGAANHDHDLVQELSKRLDGLWRFDQCIANAEGKPEAGLAASCFLPAQRLIPQARPARSQTQ